MDKIEELTKQKDNAYWERNQLVLALTKIYPSWRELHPASDTTWDNDWRNIIFIQLPTGQASWHIHDSELNYFEHLEFKEGDSWDGHTTEEKYERLRSIKDQELEEYARQKQLELLDEIIIDGFPLPISLDRESWYDIGVSTGARIVTNYYENYIREKREQLTSDRKAL